MKLRKRIINRLGLVKAYFDFTYLLNKKRAYYWRYLNNHVIIITGHKIQNQSQIAYFGGYS